jgi:hypothetical protein
MSSLLCFHHHFTRSPALRKSVEVNRYNYHKSPDVALQVLPNQRQCTEANTATGGICDVYVYLPIHFQKEQLTKYSDKENIRNILPIVNACQGYV